MPSVGRGEPINPEVGRGVSGGGNNLAGAGVGLGVIICIGLDVDNNVDGEIVGSFVWPLYVGLLLLVGFVVGCSVCIAIGLLVGSDCVLGLTLLDVVVGSLDIVGLLLGKYTGVGLLDIVGV